MCRPSCRRADPGAFSRHSSGWDSRRPLRWTRRELAGIPRPGAGGGRRGPQSRPARGAPHDARLRRRDRRGRRDGAGADAGAAARRRAARRHDAEENGFDVCRRLKGDAATAAIPVLLVTSLDAREDRLAGIGAGANDFLTKPIDAADLLLRVRNAVLTKRLYDREAEQRRQLEALEAARDTLTHMIVHDIRSPLTGLHAYLGLLDRAAAEGALGDVLEFARDAHALTARIGELVSQVLDVSRLESGH